jgi:hypothetical protein
MARKGTRTCYANATVAPWQSVTIASSRCVTVRADYFIIANFVENIASFNTSVEHDQLLFFVVV